jgi:hypothetical protein
MSKAWKSCVGLIESWQTSVKTIELLEKSSELPVTEKTLLYEGNPC